MAYLQARSGIARSGVTHCGWTPPRARVVINGTDRTANVVWEGFSIQEQADNQPATCAFTLKNFTPTLGNDAKVTYSTPNDYLFAGTLLEAETNVTEFGGGIAPLWHCVATGYQWLIDSRNRVTHSYRNRAVNHIAADILARFTLSTYGFRVGYIASSLGSIAAIDFSNETVSDALLRVAKTAGATCVIGLDKTVSMLVGDAPEAALPTIGNSSTNVRDLRYTEDYTQVRTRVRALGGGPSTTSITVVGATTIAVDECGWFYRGQGLGEFGDPPLPSACIAGANLLVVESVSAQSGPGTMTVNNGVGGGVTFEIPSGTQVSVFPQDDDAAAQAAAATALGGDGIVYHVIEDGRLGWGEAYQRADRDLSAFGSAIKTVEYSITDRYTHAGMRQLVSITSPITISGNFRIQRVTITPLVAGGSDGPTWNKRVFAAPIVRYISDYLKRRPPIYIP